MKKNHSLLLAAVAAVALLSACAESDVLVDGDAAMSTSKGAIVFGHAVPQNITRASLTAGASFQAGDEMAVYGFQDDNLLFNNQLVTSNGGNSIWNYSPVKYWQGSSSYAFYAFYPYSVGHTFGTKDAPYITVPTFTVADDKDSQIDLMVAQQVFPRPFNTVDFVFNHILSNVNFHLNVPAAFDLTGIDNITVDHFDVTGILSTGAYTQTSFDSNRAVGAWDSQSGTYDFPEVTTGSVSAADRSYALSTDLLLMPQNIADDARISIDYTIHYSDNSASSFQKSARMDEIVGTSTKNGSTEVLAAWRPNVRYNYILTVNPSVSNIVYDGVDWDGTSGGGDKVVSGDVVVDGNGNYWLDADRDGAGDYPIVWEDVDGDGWKEGGVDRDGDGHIDDVDQDDAYVTPGTSDGTKDTEPSDGTTAGEHYGKDVILIDADDDDIPEKQLVQPGSSNADTTVENGYLVDYDGTLNGEQVPTTKLGELAADDTTNPYNDPTSVYYQPGNEDKFFYVDVDGNGEFDMATDYPVVWADIDGDDKLEGIADKDRNGVADDNFDGENIGYIVDTDGVHNPLGMDVILIDTDDDGVAETELEREPKDNTLNPVIEFTAIVEDWENEFDATVNVHD